MVTIITTYCASLWLRRSPLFVIDDQGITVYGLLSPGFGLIRWQNIEDLTPIYGGREGSVLRTQVNNYDELLLRRNLLMQRLLRRSSLSNVRFGGQISLPIG